MTNKFKTMIAVALMSVSTITWQGCSKSEDSKPANTAPTGITTSTVSAITQTTASSGGSVGATGGADVTERGVCFDTVAGPTTTKNKTSNGTGEGSFTSSLTGLMPGKTYFAKAFATNSVGTTYGNEVSFATLAPTVVVNDPTMVTGGVSNILVNGATCAGSISDNGGIGQTISGKGIQYSTSNSISDSDPKIAGIGPESGFTANLTGLSTNTLYFYRAYATNTGGKTGYGSVESFSTSSNPSATLGTSTVTEVWLIDNATTYHAKATGNITNLNGGALVKKGFVWSASNNLPTLTSKDGQADLTDGAIGNYTIEINNLAKLQTIYVRAFVTSSFSGAEVTGYGTAIKIETFVKDRDNNLYNIVRIAGTSWMKENLKVTQYNDGTSIQNIQSAGTWIVLTEPAWSAYDNLDANKNLYGLLYNHYTLETSKNVCPVGWHVPTKAEFQGFVANIPGGIPNLVANVSGWAQSGSNPYGFSMLPSGVREGSTGAFTAKGIGSWNWLKGNESALYGNQYVVNSSVPSGIVNFADVKGGESIRCMKD